jgi:hypothetical protein
VSDFDFKYKPTVKILYRQKSQLKIIATKTQKHKIPFVEFCVSVFYWQKKKDKPAKNKLIYGNTLLGITSLKHEIIRLVVEVFLFVIPGSNLDLSLGGIGDHR